jgi:hypothetical protein
LKQGISVVGDALIIDGTPNPDHILIKADQASDGVRVVFDGLDLGSFGPVARIVVRAGDGDDVVVVDPQVVLPARLEGGAGDDCLQGGSGPDQLFGEEGNDVLIGTPGRDALHGGPGSNRIIIPSSMGEIRVAPSADSDVMQQLTTVYTLRDLLADADNAPGPGAAPGGPSPILLGVADLGDARLAPLLAEAYQAGQAVALTNATAADAAQLRRLLGHPGAAEGPQGDETAALIFVRQAPRPGGTTDYSTGIFAHLLPPAPPTQGRALEPDPDEQTSELLSRVFAATAIVPEAPGDSPGNNLLQLANSYTSSHVVQDPNSSSLNQIQIVNSVWNVRSFQNQEDLYYVLQEVDYSAAASVIVQFLIPGLLDTREDTVNSSLIPGGTGNLSVIQTSPPTTQETTTVTSGTSFSIGGSVGFNQVQGFNASISGGVTISNSKTTTIPPYTISNLSNLATGEPQWTYDATPQLITTPSVLVTFFNQWIWTVPFTTYPSGQLDVQLQSVATEVLDYHTIPPIPGLPDRVVTLVDNLTSVIPMPFGDTFALQRPVVLSVSPTCANAGDTFTITGTGLYPGLVTGVLIGGSPLDSRQFSTVSDTALSVVAPAMAGASLPVVVQTSQGESNDNVTLEISVSGACHS